MKSLRPAEVFPSLRSSSHLKKFDNYVLVHDFRLSRHNLIHPSHALILSLCSGSLSVEQIAYLIAETYQLEKESALELVNDVLDINSFFLNLSNIPESKTKKRYDPKEFLYKIKDNLYRENDYEPLPVPIGISLSLTLKCNFHCVYCYQISSAGEERLNLKKCLEIVDEAGEWGVVYFGLTGGEPTLFNGWISLIEKIISYNMSPVFTTNGSVIGINPIIAKRLKSIGLQEITISLDTSDPDLHHKITTTKRTFSHVINAIKFLLAEGIHVSIKYVLMPLNLPGLEEDLDFLVDLGVSEIGISFLEYGSPGSRANDAQNISITQFNSAMEVIRLKRKQNIGICNIYPPRDAFATWDENGIFPCGGLFTGMSIFPSGNVTICDKLSNSPMFVYGNVFENSLKEIWNSRNFKQLRARTVSKSQIDPECAQCSKLELCRTGCFIDSYAKFGDYFAKHPNCGGPF